MRSCWFSLSVALLLVVSCSPAPEHEAPAAATPAAEQAAPAAPAAAGGDALHGTWTGDWGPSASDRNDVTLELKWDGTNLTGLVNPGPNAIQLSKAAFNPDTGMVTMEADAQGRGGLVHYVIEGKLEGDTMSGTWNHDDRKGDFKITKS